MTLINATVAQTIYNMVDFGGNSKDSVVALCAAMFAIVIWATAAWAFGIPTSESHALIAGLSGAAIALQGGFSGINDNEWIKVIYGLFISTILGFSIGFVVVKIIEKIFKNIDRRRSRPFSKSSNSRWSSYGIYAWGSRWSKFMGVFMLGVFLANGQSNVTNFTIPVWLMLLCS